MADCALKTRLSDEMKSALRSKDKARLAVLRLALAEIKQREVDERIELSDEQVVSALDKMLKQRRDSIQQYDSAGRTDLADQERYELRVLQEFLPEQLDESALDSLIASTLSEIDAQGMKDMGKVMATLKPRLQGRADMSVVSQKVKQALTA